MLRGKQVWLRPMEKADVRAPLDDAEMAHFARTERTSHCPFKGNANYYSLAVDGETATDAVWTYESPKPDVAAIKDHLAFYPNLVEILEEEIP